MKTCDICGSDFYEPGSTKELKLTSPTFSGSWFMCRYCWWKTIEVLKLKIPEYSWERDVNPKL